MSQETHEGKLRANARDLTLGAELGIIVGAGIAGLACAHVLRDAGVAVHIVEKSTGIGGRIATRALGSHAFDYGTPHVAAQTSPFRQLVATMVAQGHLIASATATTPHQTAHAQPSAQPATHHIGSKGLRPAFASYAHGLVIELGRHVVRIERTPNGCTIHTRDGACFSAKFVVLAIPLPQATQLLMPYQGSAARPEVPYESAVIVTLLLRGAVDCHSASLDELSRQSGRVTLTPVAEQTLMRIDLRDVERAYAEADEQLIKRIVRILAEHAREPIVVASHIKRWRYARPLKVLNSSYFDVFSDGRVLLAGDAFAAVETPSMHITNVESAWTSGVAAGERIVQVARMTNVNNASD